MQVIEILGDYTILGSQLPKKGESGYKIIYFAELVKVDFQKLGMNWKMRGHG